MAGIAIRTCRRIKKNTKNLDVTIVGQPGPTRGSYFKLQYGKGDKTLVREDLACAQKIARKDECR